MAQVEKEIDRLYGLPLDEFTRERNETAKRLAKAGDADEAERVKALPKPSVVAWAVNQLARRDRDGVKRLLAAGRALRKAHRAALAGTGGDAVAEASAREREAVTELVAAGGRVLVDAGRPATQATLDKLGTTLHAAAVDLEVAKTVEAGRLETEVEPFGFGPLLTAAPAPAREPPTKPKQATRQKKDDRAAELRRRRREVQEALRDARKEEQKTERAARDAHREADKTREQAERAEARAAEAAKDADRATARVAELERELEALRA